MSGIPAWAYRGAKVVCVDAFHTEVNLSVLTEGSEYTIERVIVGGSSNFGGSYRKTQVLVRVAELANPFLPNGCFALERFKPLITQQDDISTHFAQYLNAPHKPVREGV